MQSLKDKVIVITGSTGGLGNGVAEACLEEGAKLALMDVNEETLAQQMSVLGNIHNVRSWVVDVRNMESLQQAMDEAAAYFGGIDIVFANAGITAFAPMETMQPDVFERVIDINLTGVWRTFHAAIPHIKKSKGYLLATASMASFFHSPLQAHYTSSKAAVWAMCNSIRLELRPYGVSVGTIHPTFFRTAMMENTLQDSAGSKLWGGNRGGFWKMISCEDVVRVTVRMMKKRQSFRVVPLQMTVSAKIADLLRPVLAMLFKDKNIRESIDSASVTGWNKR
ncbi:MAG: short-chain dehydrogenase [Oleibacter sp.]|nr:short-chain dehydrogenase [Thalassolituus sp.]|tara:strand:+ start:736 stop:1575 length:840 start_codon:yes stop_codon:yes gene_type:complete